MAAANLTIMYCVHNNIGQLDNTARQMHVPKTLLRLASVQGQLDNTDQTLQGPKTPYALSVFRDLDNHLNISK